MRQRLMTNEEKSRIFRLMRNASKAHSAVKAAEHNPKATQDELIRLRSEASTAADTLQDAVRDLNSDQVKELSSSAQYTITHEPLMAACSGKWSWDNRLASQMANALRSLRNALILKNEQESRGDERVIEVSKRIYSTEAFVNLVEATGVPPVKGDRKGLDYEVVQFLFRKLNDKIAELNGQVMTLGDTEDEKRSQLRRKASDLNDLYAEAEKALKFLKPYQRQERNPQQNVPKTVPTLGDQLGAEAVEALQTAVAGTESASVPVVPETSEQTPTTSRKTRRSR